MKPDRRSLLQGLGGVLTLPALESVVGPQHRGWASSLPADSPKRLLVVANPLGAHPEHFFPKQFGASFQIPKTLSPLQWLEGRFTVLSHTDHGMKSGHGREKSFLSGVLPESAEAYPEKNMSLDQVIARQIGGDVRFPSVHASLKTGIRMVYDGNGVEIKPYTNVNDLFDHLFLNLTPQARDRRRHLLERNESILDAVRSQLASVQSHASESDKRRLDQFATSIREMESRLDKREQWIGRDKPKFDLSPHLSGEVTIHRRYDAIFDMIAYAFQSNLTRVATVAFPNELDYTEIEGVTRGYHACTHNGKDRQIVSELVAVETFQMEQLSRFLRQLEAVDEPDAEGTMLDHTVVLFGSGMGYGGTHSNRNLPILVAGGPLKHRGHVDTRSASGNNMPLCNLYLTLLQRFGIERDQFNLSTGTFDLHST